MPSLLQSLRRLPPVLPVRRSLLHRLREDAAAAWPGRAEEERWLAGAVARLRAGSSAPGDRRRLADYLDSRNWNRLFSQIGRNDRIVVLLGPGSRRLTPRALEQAELGAERTDLFASVLRRRLRSAAPDALELLAQEGDCAVFRLAADWDLDMVPHLTAVCRALDADLAEVLRSLVAEALAEARDAEGRAALASLQAHLAGEQGRAGYRITFGVSRPVVPDAVGYQAQAVGLFQAFAMATVAREGGGPGLVFAPEAVRLQAADLRRLREEIVFRAAPSPNVLHDGDERLAAFLKEEDGWYLNREAVRRLWSPDFHPREGESGLTVDLRRYIAKLNILDLELPYRTEELAAGEPVRAQVSADREAARRLRQDTPLSAAESRRLAARIERDPLSGMLTPPLFHEAAARLGGAAYLAVEHSDHRLKLLGDREHALRPLEAAADNEVVDIFADAVHAGDAALTAVRELRTKALRLVARQFPGVETGTLAVPSGAVFVLPLAGLERPADFACRLRQGTDGRVTLVVRRSGPGARQRWQGHGAALERTREGAHLAAAYEQAGRRAAPDAWSAAFLRQSRLADPVLVDEDGVWSAYVRITHPRHPGETRRFLDLDEYVAFCALLLGYERQVEGRIDEIKRQLGES